MLSVDTDLHSWKYIAKYISQPDHIILNDSGTLVFKNIEFINKSGVHEIILSSHWYSNIKFIDCFFKSANGDFGKVSKVNKQENNFEFQNCFFSQLHFLYTPKLTLSGKHNCDSLVMDRVDKLALGDIQFRKAKISNCDILQPLEIAEKDGITLDVKESCFRQGLILKNTQFKELKLSKLQFDKSNGSFTKIASDTPVQLEELTGLSKLSIKQNGQKIGIHQCESSDVTIYQNKGGIDLHNCTISNAKVNQNKDCEVSLIDNTIEEELLFDKNKVVSINLANQQTENIKFTSNSGTFVFSNTEKVGIPDLKSNGFKNITVSNITAPNQDLELNCENLTKVLIDGTSFKSLKLTVLEADNISIQGCSGQLDTNISNSGEFSIKGYNKGLESLISVKDTEKVSIEDSEFKDLIITGSVSKNLELKNIKSHTISTENFMTGSIKISIVEDLSNPFIEHKFQADSLKLNSTKSRNTSLVGTKFKNIQLKSFESKHFNSSNQNFQNLAIENCSLSNLSFTNDITNSEKQPGWCFEKLPSQKISISDESIINKLFLSKKVNKSGNNLQILSILESTIQYLEVSELPANIESKHSGYGRFLISDTKKQTPGIIVSEGDHINALEVNCGHLSKLTIKRAELETCDILYSSINELTVDQCQKSETFSIGRLQIEDLANSKILLTDNSIEDLRIIITKPESLKIKNLKTINMAFNDFAKAHNSTGAFELIGINKGETIKAQKLEFQESDLSGIRFNSCYFDSFEQLLVKESTLDEIKCTATTWPKKVTSVEGKSKQFDIREGCRQLKLAMANHQDRVSELQFHSLEMAAYSKIVLSKKITWKFWIGLNDKISLLAGWTNIFGLNWGLPILGIFLIISLHYVGLIWSHHGVVPFTDGFRTTLEPSDYFILYNPTHRISQLSLQGDISWCTALIDFSSKIASAFFIYQIVAAFRKFKRT